MNSIKRDIIIANIHSMMGFDIDNNDGEVKPHITEELRILEHVLFLTNAMKKLRFHKKEIKFTPTHKNERYSRETKSLIETILCMLNGDQHEINAMFPFHETNPYAQAFFDTYNRFEPLLKPFSPYNRFYDNETRNKFLKILEEFVKKLIDTMNSREFKKRIERFIRTSRENYKSGTEYINALFNNKSRILVVRLDLGYRKHRDRFFRLKNNGASISNAQEQIDKLLRFVRHKSTDNAYLGYMMAMHYGLLKSYHFHLVVFFDGNKVREGINIAKKIGVHWEKKITGGLGLYYNCNRHRDDYRYKATGLIKHDDKEGREGLHYITTYLTMTDIYIRMRHQTGVRIFRRGKIPAEKTETRGRKRVYNSINNQISPI